MMMKFIDVDPQQQLVFSQKDIPKPKAGECLVKVKAIGVNRADLLQRAGKYPAPAGESPILGLEVSGQVVGLGENVNQWQIADKVFGLVAGGGYAEYVTVKAEHLLALPEHFSFSQGAATAEVFLTAYQSLFFIAKLKPKQNVLIHAGASGVGSAAIQLAKAIDCDVVTTLGSDEKAAACITFGADHALNYHQTDFVKWSKEFKPQGYQVILDVVAGDYVSRNVNIAALDAHIVILAMLAGRYAEQLDIAKLLQKRITLQASTLRNRDIAYKTSLVENFQRDFGQALIDGSIKPVIDSCYPWGETEQAHQKMMNNINIGKLILQVD